MDIIKFEEMAQTASQQNNCRVYDIYKHRDRLQVFIDKKNQSAVKLEDCENVFHSLRFLLRSELPHVLESKRLEVSSPGLEKSLRKKWHFEECIGQKIKITTHEPISVKSKKTGRVFRSQALQGTLKSIKNDTLSLNSFSIECELSLNQVKSAALILNVSKGFNNKKRS